MVNAESLKATKLHFCYNGLLFRWEIRDSKENALYSGTLDQCKELLGRLRNE